MVECEQRRQHGRLTAGAQYRLVHDVLLQEGPPARSVNGVESTGINAKTGAQLSSNPLLTHQPLHAEAGAQVAQAGRGRWKVENAHTNVRQTQGYHLEQNFGHGQQSLAATLLSVNWWACLCQTVLEGSDQKSALLRQVRARRQTFFDDMQALTRSMVFPSWPHLLDFMIEGLALASKLEPDLGPPLNTSWS
jgi:hypothetical protein